MTNSLQLRGAIEARRVKGFNPNPDEQQFIHSVLELIEDGVFLELDIQGIHEAIIDKIPQNSYHRHNQDLMKYLGAHITAHQNYHDIYIDTKQRKIFHKQLQQEFGEPSVMELVVGIES